MDLNERLKKISYYYKDYGYIIDSLVFDGIRKLLSNYACKYNSALLGAGEHTESLLRDFKDELKGIPIIDKNAAAIEVTDLLKGHEIFSYDYINAFDCIIISSKKYMDEVKDRLKDMEYKGCILDIYSSLESEGIVVPTEYYNLNEYPYIRDLIAGNLIDFIENKNNPKLRGQLCSLYLFNIYSSIERRDLLYSKEHIKSYIQFIDNENIGYMHPVERNVLDDTLQELADIEAYIKNVTAKRGNRDILLFWLDGLRDELSRELPYLNTVRNEGIDFKNAIASSISTRNTYGCIMEESKEIELFAEERDNNILNEYLLKQGFDNFHVSSHGVMPLGDFDYINSDLGLFSEASTKVLFDTLDCLLNSKKPVFIMTHIMVEPHPPFISPDTKVWDKYKYGTYGYHLFDDEKREEFLEGALISALYMDRQLSYYMELFGNNPTKLFFSDHGYMLESKTPQYSEDMAHITMCLQGEGIEHRREEKLIQTENIGGLIRYILTKDIRDYKKCVSDTININGIDSYNMTWISYLIKFDTAQTGVQFNGVRTLKDMYILEATGDEHYYILPDWRIDFINNSDYEDRIEYLRSLLNRKSININKHPKFKDAHIIYEALGKSFVWN